MGSRVVGGADCKLIRYVIALGAVYVLPLALAPAVLQRTTSEDLLARLGWLLLLRAPAAVGLAIVIAANPRVARSLRASLRAWLAAGVCAALLSFILSATRAWPWVWQWPNSPAFVLARELAQGPHVVASTAFALGWGVVSPAIEETVFRGGLLAFSSRSSRVFATSASAVFFTLAHFGGRLPLPGVQSTHAAWLLVFSLVLSCLTFAERWGLGAAIAAHSSRNLTEIATSLIAAVRLTP